MIKDPSGRRLTRHGKWSTMPLRDTISDASFAVLAAVDGVLTEEKMSGQVASFDEVMDHYVTMFGVEPSLHNLRQLLIKLVDVGLVEADRDVEAYGDRRRIGYSVTQAGRWALNDAIRWFRLMGDAQGSWEPTPKFTAEDLNADGSLAEGRPLPDPKKKVGKVGGS